MGVDGQLLHCGNRGTGLGNVEAGAIPNLHSLALRDDGIPRITVQPRSQSVARGQIAEFRVMAVGQPPLQYAWSKNG